MRTCPISEGVASIVERPSRKSRLHVLLVEDYVESEQGLEAILRAEGHAVRVATDGETALELAEEEAPDVVLLDLDVAGLDSGQVAQALRELIDPKRPLLIAVSGPDTPEDRLSLLPVRIDLHLVKPLAIKSLLNLLWRFRGTIARSPESQVMPGQYCRLRTRIPYLNRIDLG